jgi:hypothetical protein
VDDDPPRTQQSETIRLPHVFRQLHREQREFWIAEAKRPPEKSPKRKAET